MNIESKFLFISRFFVLLFFIINFTYLIPFNIFEITYYFNFSTAIVDTTTLLILGLSFPKFIYLKRLHEYEVSNKNNANFSSEAIDFLKMKIFYNSRISYFLSIFFIILALIQPLNIIFTLNKNDIYTSSIVQQFNNRLIFETQKLEQEFNINNEDLSSNKESIEFDERIKTIKNITKENLDTVLNNNNKVIFNKINFIIRNIVMGIIWAMVFYNLSVL